MSLEELRAKSADLDRGMDQARDRTRSHEIARDRTRCLDRGMDQVERELTALEEAAEKEEERREALHREAMEA